MQSPSEHPSDFPHPSHVPGPSLWRKLGGGSLSISIAVHAILLAAGVIWIFQVIPQKPDPDFASGGVNGGPPGARAQIEQRKTAKALSPPSLVRVVINGVCEITLPKPDASASMASIGAADPLQGTMGFGNGPGGTHGPRGSIAGPSLGDPSYKPLGLPDPDANALVGTFYDTKQDPRRKDTGMTADKLREVIKDFTTRGWNERTLESKYFKAPKTLYQTKLYIPEMTADAAPAAFGCEKEVQPGRWIVLYRGNVSIPESGKYRFVGAGDDVLVVRFNGQNVFDHGFTQGTTGLYVQGKVEALAGRTEDREVAKLTRGGAMKTPITFYQYETTRNWNQSIGGLAVGSEFEAVAGKSYPIEILLSEIPGGLFGASLLVEKVGVSYPKASTGAPILPLFRLDSSLPAATKADNAPPYDPNGSVWKLIDRRIKPGI